MLDDVYARSEARMSQSVDSIRRELSSLRTGHASIAILEGVMVDYYGTATPLEQTSKLAVPDPGMIMAQPFDPSMLGDIERAILGADLGLNPSNDGKVIRIPIPPLTEERRKQLAKKVGQMVEDGRTAVRHIRRDANDEIKTLEKDSDSGVSQDDSRRALERVQKLTDEYVKKIEELGKAKEKELMEF